MRTKKLSAALALIAATNLFADERVDFEKQILPILQKNCTTCHGAAKQKAGLRLERGSQVMKGSLEGPIVVAKKPKESRLLPALRGDGDLERMPPTGPLPEAEIRLIEKWIEQGATIPAESSDANRHWAFVPPVRRSPPKTQSASSSPIDAFLAAERLSKGVTAAAEADPQTLVRRAYNDLTGLPPSLAERDSFLADDSPDAYERLVDRLLSSPRYGERWGRHFLDVWRYSDWYGFGDELRNSQKNIWNWRDWVVESFNENKPYDRMIHEMLAADELAPTDRNALRATGYLARSYYKFNRNVWLDDIVEHTGKAFLGVTLNCARCHDHMYDPIGQQEYFQVRAIFEPHNIRLDAERGDANAVGIPRAFDADLKAATFLFERGDDKRPQKDKPLSPTAPKELCSAPFAAMALAVPREIAHPTLNPTIAGEQIERAITKLNDAKSKGSDAGLTAAVLNLAAVEAMLAADQARYPAKPAANHKELTRHAVSIHSAAKVAEAAASLGEAERDLADKEKAAKEDQKAIDAAKKKAVEANSALVAAKKAIDIPPTDYPPLAPSYPESSTGRRLAFANWITANGNPLTARVFVNHVWMRHFGQPLVPTVFDFGKNGRPPSHPALLDWLAVEFVESGWDVKKLHRLIMTSRAYRMSSSFSGAVGDANRKRDPDNVLLWRQYPRPLEAEALRDGVLAVAGLLDEKMGGPEIVDDAKAVGRRRAIYFRHAPEKMSVFLTTMDGASPTECYRRPSTVVPQQGMAMLNSPLTAAAAEAVAKSVGEQQPNRAVGALFLRILGREPIASETTLALEFLKRHPPAALAEVLFNHVDFITLR